MLRAQTQKLFFFLPVIFAFAFLSTALDYSNLRSQSVTKRKCESNFFRIFNQQASSYRRCLLDKLNNSETSPWDQSHKAVNACLTTRFRRQFNVSEFYSRYGVKFVIFPSPINQSTVLVTLGIGNDIKAEKELRQVLPKIKFYGAEPINASGFIYREIGKFFETAVGAESGFFESYVLENGRYIWKNVSTTALDKFVKERVKRRRIDYLWIDIEGAEHEIFRKYFTGNYFNLSICQVTVKFHGWSDRQTSRSNDRFKEMKLSVLSNSFLPIRATSSYHMTEFYFNMADRYCVKKFLASKVCGE